MKYCGSPPASVIQPDIYLLLSLYFVRYTSRRGLSRRYLGRRYPSSSRYLSRRYRSRSGLKYPRF